MFLKRADLIFDPIRVTKIPLSFSIFVKFLPVCNMIFSTDKKFSSPASTKTLGFVVSDLYFNSAVPVTPVLIVGVP